jgi:long-chain acyl-CoA synthetase
MEDRIWHRAYDREVPVSIDYQAITLAEAVRRAGRDFPDRTALLMMGKKITYRELDHLVDRFAMALTDLGIRKGDKVALILPNIPQIVVAAFAVMRLGGVVVMNNPLYTERELEHQLNDSGSKVAVCLDLLVPRILNLRDKTGIETIIACHIRDHLPFPAKQLFPLVKRSMHRKIDPKEGVLAFTDLVKKHAPSSRETDVSFDDLACLQYTGGTTGVSKGVMLTHRNLSCNVQQLAAWTFDVLEGQESVMGIFPFFHTAGFMAVMNHSVFRGLTNILVPRPDPSVVLELTLKYRPTYFPCVPTIYVGLLNHPDFSKADLGFIKGCMSGAAPLAVETIRQWEDAVGQTIMEVYGLTESSPLSHGNPWRGVQKPGSAGIPVSDTDCRIVDVDTGTEEMSLGAAGEILLKGPQVTRGYFNRPQETEETIRDGWLFTGDIGYMDDDGYLFIVDRKKDMIIAGGYNIYPRDIDEILYAHPKIQEACAVGVPDEYRGETVKAFIVTQPGETLSEEELNSYCREKLAAYKVPKLYEFRDELPKSAIGKVLRRELRQQELERAQKTD